MKVLSKTLRGLYYAIRVLLKPKDIESLLKVGDILSDSKALQSAAAQAKKDPDAAALILERYSRSFPSHEVLEKMPAESLGRALVEHLKIHGLGNYPERSIDRWTDAIYLRERQRQIHDLIHALLGLGIIPIEEACVNAFLMARTGAPISVLIVFGVLLRSLFKNPTGVLEDMNAIFDAWSAGRNARSPFGYRWEENLDVPLAEVRRAFGISLEGLGFAKSA